MDRTMHDINKIIISKSQFIYLCKHVRIIYKGTHLKMDKQTVRFNRILSSDKLNNLRSLRT